MKRRLFLLPARRKQKITDWVLRALYELLFTDIHTHLVPSQMKALFLSGFIQLLNYHYLHAEFLRANPGVSEAEFMAWSPKKRARAIWQTLFIENSPLSEACMGVITVLTAFGLKPSMGFNKINAWFEKQSPKKQVTRVLRLAGVRELYMTNDPLDPKEWPLIEKGLHLADERFIPVNRLDRIVVRYADHIAALQARGYEVTEKLTAKTIAELKRFVRETCDIIHPAYLALSLPPEFEYETKAGGWLGQMSRLYREVILESAKELNLPVAIMVGVIRRVNDKIGDAGDASGKWDLRSLGKMAKDYRDVKFIVTVLSQENQRELCDYARKFGNLVIFGLWWFNNTHEQIRQVTEWRLALLGLTFVPQHSDARVLEHLIYKWQTAREVMAEVFAEYYIRLAMRGGDVTQKSIRRDIKKLFDGSLIAPNAKAA